ncbi:alpha/beta hydrolase YcfP [Vibrio methylphosphonaticus]|uniref:alpha/beta hydrolase YcfP n=1 Tax=Vibrio methylphosphonaticus TaxID=2946866 RepID=UPI00202A45EF|nr:alpha/beta hydrolase YcfP [Vibrio methylphosphonaticus]MCL9774662.1 alpha/beta hydrolase YcfP [Vibrio methylphosphonaticus]
MIIYLHGYDSSSPGNHEKVLQLQFIDDDVRFVNYSTLHPKHDMQHLLKEVHKLVEQSDDNAPLICGVGLGGFWSERIGFLCGIKQVIFNPNLRPEINMQGRIDRPEEYEDIATKCVEEFRTKNSGQCLVILSRNDSIHDNQKSADELQSYYDVIWDENEPHKFKKISQHLQAMKAFKAS